MATVAKSAAKTPKAAKNSKAAKASEESLVERMKNWPERFRTFYEGVRREMKLVTWPTREQVQSTTVVVLVTVFLFALYFFVVDYALSSAISRLYQYFTN
jgi:preprotein translocase subunit SecE